MSQRNPGRRGFYGEGDDGGSDGGLDDAIDEAIDQAADAVDQAADDPGGAISDAADAAGDAADTARDAAADAAEEASDQTDGGASGPSDGGSGGSAPDPGSSPAPPRGVPDPSDGGDAGGGGAGGGRTGDQGTTRTGPGASPAPPGGVAPPDDAPPRTGGTDGPTIDPGSSPAPPGGVAPPDDGGGGRPEADPSPSPDTGQGYSGDPNPTGGIGPNVPARARGQATDLRQEAADQWRGAVGPEDIMVSFDEESGQLEAELTASGRRELAAREAGVDPEDIRLGEEIVGTGTSPVGGEAPPGGGGTRTTAELTPDARRERAREQIAAQIDDAGPGDIRVEPTGDGGYQLASFSDPRQIGSGQQDVQEFTEMENTVVSGDQAVPTDSFGQTTDPTYDPSSEQPAGIFEAATDVARRTIEDPGGYVGGGTAEFFTETEFVDVDPSQRNEQVSVPGYDRIRDPVQGAAQWWDENVGEATATGAEYVTGSETVGQVYGGIARGVNPAGAVDAGLGAHEAAAYTVAGAAEGPGEVVGRAGEATERGFYVAGRGVEAAQRNPARTGGMVVGGALVGTAASAGARAGVSGARTAATRLRRSDGPEPVGGTDVRSGAPDPWEGIDPSRSLREQAGPDRGRVQQLAADARQIWRSERGQAQMVRGRQRQRGGGERQRRGGGTTDDVRQDALTQYQDYLDDVAARERAATRRQADPDADPVGADRPQPTYDPEAPQVPLRERPDADADAAAAGFRVRDPAAEATGMLAQAQRQEATVGDTFDAQEEALSLTEQAGESDLVAEARQTATVQEIARTEAVQEPQVTDDTAATGVGDDSRLDPTLGVDQTPGTDTGQRTGTGQRERTGQRAGPTTTVGTPTRTPPPDDPLVPVTPPGTPGGPPRDPPGTGTPRPPTFDPDVSPGRGPSPSTDRSASILGFESDSDPGVSWLSETLAAFGGADLAGRAPATESQIGAAPSGLGGGADLPTRAQAEDAEEFERAVEFFTFGDGDGESGGDSGGEAEGWFEW